VENLRAQIPAIKGMIESACFVGARWSWHRDFSCLVAKTGVYQRPWPKQRGLTPLISPYEDTLPAASPSWTTAPPSDLARAEHRCPAPRLNRFAAHSLQTTVPFRPDPFDFLTTRGYVDDAITTIVIDRQANSRKRKRRSAENRGQGITAATQLST
jgi:hypothetical protein